MIYPQTTVDCLYVKMENSICLFHIAVKELVYLFLYECKLFRSTFTEGAIKYSSNVRK